MNKELKQVHDENRIMTAVEFAKLGGGEVAYIKPLTSDEAGKLFPKIKGIPKGINLFALHAADGTPLALTDTLQAAIGHAMEDDLTVSAVH